MQDLDLLMHDSLLNHPDLLLFLALCPLVSTPLNRHRTLILAVATAACVVVTSLLTLLITRGLLVPLHIEYLQLVMCAVVITAGVQLTQLLVYKNNALLHQSLGKTLPLVCTQYSVLGVWAVNSQITHSIWRGIVLTPLLAVTFALLLLAFSALRERLDATDSPASFSGMPVTFITLGIMSLALLAFTGMLQ